MALYLGNNKVSMKSGYTATGFKDFLEHKGKFAYSNYTDLTGILKYEDTENVTDMTSMFERCYNLTTIPQLDTSNATTMRAMFAYSNKLTLIPKLDTSNVTNMSDMFISCSSLITIPQLDTHKVTNFSQIFTNCEKLTSIPLLYTSNAKQMDSMFRGCNMLTSIPNLDASNVTIGNQIFNYCNNLKEIHMVGIKFSFDIHYSTKFTREALVEILNNLGIVTNTRTLTMGSTNLAKLTDEDKAIATNKGWTLA